MSDPSRPAYGEMRQCMLDTNLSLVKPLPFKFPLFDLPFNIRYRVYKYAGLIRPCAVDLNYEPTRTETAPAGIGLKQRAKPTYQCYVRKHLGFCHCEPLPWGLICASREASRVFYSRNRFEVCQSWPNNLQALHNLTPTSLSALVYLSIRLNYCSSYTGSYRHLLAKSPSGDDLLKDIISSHEEWILADWTRLCERMAQHIQPRRLHLSFICDTENVKTAKAILAPLLKLPTLAQCSLRVSQYPFPQFQALAEEVVEQLTTSGKFFLFNALPIELQLRVLRQTDLIAPFHLAWTPLDGFSYADDPGALPSCPVCKDVQGVKPSVRGACATRCRCWKFPYGLFYANTMIRKEALNIFYANNHFIIPYDEPEHHPRLNLVSFLSMIPRHARSRLRSLQFHLPEGNCYDPGSEEHYELTTAVRILCAGADLSSLTLNIEIIPGWDAEYGSIYGNLQINELSGERRFLSYQKMLEPFYPLGGKLKDFIVGLPWDHHVDDEVHRFTEAGILEKMIMGEERHNSPFGRKYARFYLSDTT